MNFNVGDRVHIVDKGRWDEDYGDGTITGFVKPYYTIRTDSGLIVQVFADGMKLLPEKVRFT